ncbi:MAG: alpha-hydroxy-acid oxidizing protein [Nitriliruptoraceae bacterium]|nr:alpha-hydroxy-acid oxidizing protein [Nitriliruptoraceae bacterium]
MSSTPRRVPRQVPDLAQLQELAGFRLPSRSRTEARLARAESIAQLRVLARRRTPRGPFDYVDGAAEAEISLTRARRAFAGVEFQSRVLHDISTVDTSTRILGEPATMPVVFAPTGFTRMMQYEGELAVGPAAAELGIPYALSTLGTTSVEDLAAAVPDLDRWFQLYIMSDRDSLDDLVDRAKREGYRALVLTVDTPVAGMRLRDVRNGLTIPPQLTARTVLDMSRHPSWWWNLLTSPPLQFASFSSFDGTVAELIASIFDPRITMDDLDLLRERWDGPLVVKGIQTVEDARRVVDHGADALVISNHGGRQLDRAPTPLLMLSDVVAAVGDRAEVFLDGGITSGADVVAAVAHGARACLVGRAYLYGLMAGGEAGVRRAGQILHADIVRTLQLLGVDSIDALEPGLVRLPERAVVDGARTA